MLVSTHTEVTQVTSSAEQNKNAPFGAVFILCGLVDEIGTIIKSKNSAFYMPNFRN